MLSEKAREIFRYIVRCNRERGFPPTLREIGKEFGITSTNGVRYYVGVLERDGYVKRNRHLSRALEVPETALKRFTRLYGYEGLGSDPRQWTGIPIVGKVAAGAPLLATENVEGKLDLDEMFPGSQPRFALRITGDSMKDAGILDGDLAIIRPADHADSGDVVVAMLGDEATVKRFERHSDRAVLRPANPSYQPITVRTPEELRIVGVVIGLVRSTYGGRVRAARST